MNEDKLIGEQELDKVAGGAGCDAAFEQAWADYEQTHCKHCFHGIPGHKNEALCRPSKQSAAERWTPGQLVRCPNCTIH